MNKDIAQGKLQEWRGRIKEAWGKLTSNNSVETKGKQEIILGTLRKMHGHLAQVEQEYDKFEISLGNKFEISLGKTPILDDSHQ